MVKIKIDPAAVLVQLNLANNAGIPHEFVQVGNGALPFSNSLTWRRDGSDSGFEVELHPDGTWTATLDYGM